MHSTPHQNQGPVGSAGINRGSLWIRTSTGGANSQNENAGVWTSKNPGDVSTFRQGLGVVEARFRGQRDHLSEQMNGGTQALTGHVSVAADTFSLNGFLVPSVPIVPS